METIAALLSTQRKHAIFNGQYDVIQSLGEGRTSKVFQANERGDPSKSVALKLISYNYLAENEENVHSVEKEIEILKAMQHDNIIKIVDYGSDGTILKTSNTLIQNMVFIMMEHVKGGLLFDLCQDMGGMGESVGRFFMGQMLEALDYMHGRGVVHRDLKLENILCDEEMNLKICDFGFATYKNIKKLDTFLGT